MKQNLHGSISFSNKIRIVFVLLNMMSCPQWVGTAKALQKIKIHSFTLVL